MNSVCFNITGFNAGVEAIFMSVLSDYFDKYYDAVVSIVNSAIGISIMIMPLATQFLLDLYGWRGALLILAGLNLHLVVCGATLRTVSQQQGHCESPNTKLRVGRTVSKRLHCLSLMFLGLGAGYVITGWTVYLLPHALDLNFTPYEAALLATFGGFGHAFGSFIFPIFANCFSTKQWLYVTTAFNCIALAIYPLSAHYNTYAGLAISCVTSGMGRAILYITLYKIINESFGDDDKSNVMLWCLFANSVGSLLSGFLSGKSDSML